MRLITTLGLAAMFLGFATASPGEASGSSAQLERTAKFKKSKDFVINSEMEKAKKVADEWATERIKNFGRIVHMLSADLIKPRKFSSPKSEFVADLYTLADNARPNETPDTVNTLPPMRDVPRLSKKELVGYVQFLVNPVVMSFHVAYLQTQQITDFKVGGEWAARMGNAAKMIKTLDRIFPGSKKSEALRLFARYFIKVQALIDRDVAMYPLDMPTSVYAEAILTQERSLLFDST